MVVILKNWSNNSLYKQKSLNIDGFGEKQAKQFFDLKIINKYEDIFGLENIKKIF